MTQLRPGQFRIFAARTLHLISPVANPRCTGAFYLPMNMQQASRYGAAAFLTISRYWWSSRLDQPCRLVTDQDTIGCGQPIWKPY